MELKRDERGRPVGLQWPEGPQGPITPYKPPKPRKQYKPTGRPRGGVKKEFCKNGHSMAEWGKQTYRKDGRPNGRYCTFPNCNGGPERWERAQARNSQPE